MVSQKEKESKIHGAVTQGVVAAFELKRTVFFIAITSNTLYYRFV